MDKKFEFYKDQYHFEIERKNQLAGQLNIPIGFLTVIFSAFAYFALNISSISEQRIFIIFLILISMAAYFSFIASKHLFMAFKGLKYGYLPPLDKIYAFEKKHANNPNLESLFFQAIKLSFIETASANKQNNNFRANQLYKSNLNTLYAIIFIIAAAIPYFIGKNNIETDNKTKHQINQQYFYEKRG